MSEKRIPITILFWDVRIINKNVIDGIAILDRNRGLSIVLMDNVRTRWGSGEIGDVLMCITSPFKKLSHIGKSKWEKVEKMIATGIFIYNWIPAVTALDLNKECPFNGGKI